jgi:single-strand DNA-binding protein
MTWHQTIVVGNLGSDPDMKALPSGTFVCNFNLAVSETWSDRTTNEKREKTTWYRVATYGRQAEIAKQYLSKGRQVMVIGTVEANAFMGQDGQPRASLELRAREIKFLRGGNDSGGGSSSSSGDDYDNYSAPPQDMDDIPF